jgi:hypothetical protein
MASHDSDSSSGESSSDVGCSGDSDRAYQGHSYGLASDYPNDDSSSGSSSSETDHSKRNSIIPRTLKTIAGLGFIGLCTLGGVKSGNYTEAQLQIRQPSRAAYGCNVIAPVVGGLSGLLLGSTVAFLYCVKKKQ